MQELTNKLQMWKRQITDGNSRIKTCAYHSNYAIQYVDLYQVVGAAFVVDMRNGQRIVIPLAVLRENNNSQADDLEIEDCVAAVLAHVKGLEHIW